MSPCCASTRAHLQPAIDSPSLRCYDTRARGSAASPASRGCASRCRESAGGRDERAFQACGTCRARPPNVRASRRSRLLRASTEPRPTVRSRVEIARQHLRAREPRSSRQLLLLPCTGRSELDARPFCAVSESGLSCGVVCGWIEWMDRTDGSSQTAGVTRSSGVRSGTFTSMCFPRSSLLRTVRGRVTSQPSALPP